MATSNETVKTISIVSLMGLLVFSVVWMFASGAVVSIPPHSLGSDLLEIGRPIQAVAVDIESGVRRRTTAASASESGPVVPEVLVAVARPVARTVEQLTQPIAAVQTRSSGDPAASSSKASRDKAPDVSRDKDEGPSSQGTASQGTAGKDRSRKVKDQSKKGLTPPSKQGKSSGKKKV